jgi:site-specific DNA recombinase
MSRQVGLARVSTSDQDPFMQRRSLERAGVPPGNIIERELSSVSDQWKRERDAILAGLKPGDELVVFKFDRLGRSLADLVAVINDLHERGVIVKSLTEGLDLSTPGGRFAFHVLASAAEFERELIRERTSVGRRTRIEAGGIAGGRRLYGFAADGVTHVPHEATVIREVTRRLCTGEPMYDVVANLNARNLPTAFGGAWTPRGLKKLLLNPRLVGLHSYRGKILGPGTWEPIITPGEQQELAARFPKFIGQGAGGGAPFTYTYSNLISCDVCKTGKIQGNSRGSKGKWYACANPKCHRVSMSARLLERDLNIAVIFKLLDPAFVAHIAALTGNDPSLGTRLTEDRQLLVRLARQFGEGVFGEDEWRAMRTPIEQRIRAAEERLADEPSQALLASLEAFKRYGNLTIDQLERLEDAGEQIDTPLALWLSWPIERRRQILRLIIDRAVLKPATQERTKRGTRAMRVAVSFR